MIEKNEMIFGIRAVIEAIEAGKEIDKVLIKKDMQSELAKDLFAALKHTFIPVQRVPVERIDRITRKNHQGVVAFVSPITYQRTEDLVPFLYQFHSLTILGRSRARGGLVRCGRRSGKQHRACQDRCRQCFAHAHHVAPA